MLAVEYDGDQHRDRSSQFAYDIVRSEDLDELGWTRIRVVEEKPSSRCHAPTCARLGRRELR